MLGDLGHISSLCLSFPVYQMVNMMVPASGSCETQRMYGIWSPINAKKKSFLCYLSWWVCVGSHCGLPVATWAGLGASRSPQDTSWMFQGCTPPLPHLLAVWRAQENLLTSVCRPWVENQSWREALGLPDRERSETSQFPGWIRTGRRWVGGPFHLWVQHVPPGLPSAPHCS